MTDLEATRLCAVAMGYENPRIQSGCRGTQYVAYGRAGIYATEFRPLHDDAQAMALVKRLRVWITTYKDEAWLAQVGGKAVRPHRRFN